MILGKTYSVPQLHGRNIADTAKNTKQLINQYSLQIGSSRAVGLLQVNT